MKGFKLKFWLIPLLLLGILVVAARTGIFTMGQAQKQHAGPAAVAVTAGHVQYVSKTPALSLTGSIEGKDSAAISAKIGGRIAQIFAEDGKQVQAGQPLIKLESVELANAVRVAQDAVNRAAANYANVKTNYTRYQTLFNQNAISKQQLDSAETSLKVAETDLSSAYANLSSAEQQYEYSTVIAPVDGVVANKSATIGQVVAVGQPLMTVENIGQVYAVVNIEQKHMGVVKAGIPAAITVDAFPGQVFSGTVEIINPAAGSGNRMFKTKIIFDNNEQKLKPGMFVKANIVTGSKVDVLAVPQSAIYQNQGIYYVYSIRDNKAVRQQVEIGQPIGTDIEIKSGLSEKTVVATSNVNNLKDGDILVVSQ